MSFSKQSKFNILRDQRKVEKLETHGAQDGADQPVGRPAFLPPYLQAVQRPQDLPSRAPSTLGDLDDVESIGYVSVASKTSKVVWDGKAQRYRDLDKGVFVSREYAANVLGTLPESAKDDSPQDGAGLNFKEENEHLKGAHTGTEPKATGVASSASAAAGGVRIGTGRTGTVYHQYATSDEDRDDAERLKKQEEKDTAIEFLSPVRAKGQNVGDQEQGLGWVTGLMETTMGAIKSLNTTVAGLAGEIQKMGDDMASVRLQVSSLEMKRALDAQHVQQQQQQHEQTPPVAPTPIQVQPPAQVQQQAPRCDSRKLIVKPLQSSHGSGKAAHEAVLSWLSVTGVAWDSAASFGRLLFLKHEQAAWAAWERWVPAVTSVREAIAPEMLQLSRVEGEHAAELTGPTVAKLPGGIVIQATNAFDHRGGSFMTWCLFETMKHYCLSDPVSKSEYVKLLFSSKDCTSRALYTTLANWRQSVEDAFNPGFVSESDDFSALLQAIEETMKKHTLVKEDLDYYFRQPENFKPYPRTSWSYVQTLFFACQGFAQHRYAHLRLHGNAEPTLHCTYCKIDGHATKDCRRRMQSERDKQAQAAKIAEEAKRAEEAKLADKAAKDKEKPKGGNGKGKGKGSRVCAAMVTFNSCKEGDKCAFSHDPELVKKFQGLKCAHGKECSYLKKKQCIFGVHEDKEAKFAVEQSEVAFAAGAVPTDPKSIKFGVDSCCNTVVIRHGDQKLLTLKELDEKAKLSTSNGRVDVQKALASTPIGPRKVNVADSGVPLIGMNLMVEDGQSFTWVNPAHVNELGLAAGPHIHVTNDQGHISSVHLDLENGKPMVSAQEISDAKGSRVDSSEAKTAEIDAIEEALFTLEEACSSQVDIKDTNGGPSVDRPCFACGSPSHWTRDCLAKKLVAEESPCGVQVWNALPSGKASSVLKHLAKVQNGHVCADELSYFTPTPLFPEVPELSDVHSEVFDLKLDRSSIVVCEKSKASIPPSSCFINLQPNELFLRVYKGDEVLWYLCDEGTEIETRRGVRFDAYETCLGDSVVRTSLTKEEARELAVELKKVQHSLLAGKHADMQAAGDRAQEANKEREHREGLSVIVDDIMLGAKKDRTPDVWVEIHSKLDGDGVEGLPQRYGGVRKRERWISDTCRILVEDQSEFCEKVATEFFGSTGIKTKKVASSMKEPPPVRKGGETVPNKDEAQALANPVKGVFENVAKHFVLSVSYASQCTRPDLAPAIRALESAFCRWSLQSDLDLIRFMRYVHQTAEYGIISVVDTRDVGRLRPLTNPDASVAPCRLTRKSINGFITYLTGGFGTIAPVHWRCKGMQSTALCTQEAEAGSLLLATKSALGICDHVQESTGVQTVGIDSHEDNMGLIQCLAKGGLSTNIAHSRRSHGIKLSFLSDVYSQEEHVLRWISGKAYVGDFMSGKPLSREAFELGRMQAAVVPTDILDVYSTMDVSGEVDARIGELIGELEQLDYQVEIVDAEDVANFTEGEFDLESDIPSEAYMTVNQLREKIKTKMGRDQGDAFARDAVCQHRANGETVGDKRRVAGQRRFPASKAVKEEHDDPLGRVRWRADTHGPVKPAGWQRNRYLLVVRKLDQEAGAGATSKGKYLYCYGIVSKHSTQVKEKLQEFSLRVRGALGMLLSDGGKELRGEVKEWLESVGCFARQVSERGRPQDNGGAEADVKVCILGGLTNLEIAQCPGTLWVEACQYECDVRNILSGAWRDEHGEQSLEFAVNHLCPFGWRVSFVKEDPERKADEKSAKDPPNF
ncbi:MAG: hypothetical protein CL975_03970, partial [Euryarchaeota archaeon]|nr:hypothetical protein [Euryarchaeota archaeon]